MLWCLFLATQQDFDEKHKNVKKKQSEYIHGDKKSLQNSDCDVIVISIWRAMS